MRREAKHWLLRLALFVGLLCVGGWPWAALQAGFSHVVSGIGNPFLSALSVVPGAEVELVPLGPAHARTAAQNVHEDTQVVLHVPGRSGEARIGLSLRRDAYLPLLIFMSAIMVLPLHWRAKVACLGLGTSLIIAVAIGSVAILLLFLSSQAPDAGIPGWQATLSTVLFDCWLTPPGNRVVAPLLLAAGLGLTAHRRWAPPSARPLPWEAKPANAAS